MDTSLSIPIQENGEPLVNLATTGCLLYPAYFEQGLTTDSSMYLRKGALERLLLVQEQLYPYRFKIWDGLRSGQVQGRLYAQIWQEQRKQSPELRDDELQMVVDAYVANPQDAHLVPPHMTGGAVDITLVDEVGKELDMGTAIDECCLEAHSAYFDTHRINEQARINRRMLRMAMHQAGFVSYSEEWWHYEYGTQLWAETCKQPYALYAQIDWPIEPARADTQLEVFDTVLI